ncbi:MAG: HAD family hydrolase [Bacteroidales bacterium]
MKLNGIDTIVFDLGGVLINLDRQRCIDAFAALGYDEAEELLTNYRQAGLFLQLEEGKISPDIFREGIRKGSGKYLSDHEIDHALNRFLMDLPQEKLDLILALRSRYKVCMLSNTNKIMFDYIVPQYFERDGRLLTDYFDQVFLSYEMGVAKPDKQIFEMMIAEGGLNPEKTLFVDDSVLNTDAASELGFQTYTAKPFEDFCSLFEKELL